MKGLNLKYVSDIISNDHLTNWKPGDLTIISSQTGTGKTTFILNELLDSLKGSERILYICNRIELKLEIAGKLLDKYKVNELKEIKQIKITTYQAITEQLIRDYNAINYDKKYKYIVFDECHYFISDSFNGKTLVPFYKFIVDDYHKAVRIFISATIQDIENVVYINNKDHVIHHYDTGIDYSYLDVKYFKKRNDIVQMIKNDETRDQWIVFVSSISMGNEIVKQLLNKNVSCVFVNSENNNRPISNGEYEEKVLITTKKLDNGISIHSNAVKHIVVFSYDQTTFIQEVGRVRVDIHNPRKINLYIPLLDVRSFYTLINTLYKDKRNQLELYRNDYDYFKRLYKYDTDKIYKDLFYYDDMNNKWKVNIIGESQLIKQYNFACNMIDRFMLEGKYAFVYEQLEWLELINTFDIDHVIKDVQDIKEVNSLDSYLNSITGVKLYKDEQKELIERIGLKDKRGRIQKSIKQLNLYLSENKFNYVIESKTSSSIINGKKKSIRYWIIQCK